MAVRPEQASEETLQPAVAVRVGMVVVVRVSRSVATVTVRLLVLTRTMIVSMFCTHMSA
jgi:hypothetical protein